MTASWYEAFAEREAAGQSPCYEELSRAVAASSHLIALLDQLPEEKRQPNLLFASVRLRGGPIDSAKAFVAWTVGNWQSVADTMIRRRTQTNEPRRCATLLPVLAAIPGPIALLEVGASAGLCLYPDRWKYSYGEATVGDPSGPLLTCEPLGLFDPPATVPEVVWRAGLDLNPLDVNDPQDVAWLEALIWPEQTERLEDLHNAIAVARADPPLLVTGDLNDDLPALAARAPAEATLVVFHSAVLAYVSEPERQRFVEQVTALAGHWISNEGERVLRDVADALSPSQKQGRNRFLTALDGRPVAWSGPHGQSVEML